MKKPKAERRALRAKKYEEKLISTFTFTDLTNATSLHAHKLQKIKASKKSRTWRANEAPPVYKDKS